VNIINAEQLTVILISFQNDDLIISSLTSRHSRVVASSVVPSYLQGNLATKKIKTVLCFKICAAGRAGEEKVSQEVKSCQLSCCKLLLRVVIVVTSTARCNKFH
jgi:hypothetical protein